MPGASSTEFIPAGTVEEIRKEGVKVVHGADRPIAVYVDKGNVFAVDNRCPHMGFPLHRGTVRDGILTCHWHEARFDLCSGCTFDLWADDVPAYDVRVEDGEVSVSPTPRVTPDEAYYFQRLRRGMEHGIGLIAAKSLRGLLSGGTNVRDIVRAIADFGSQYHEQWDEGMTVLAIVANLSPYLSAETRYFALVRAAQKVADDCQNAMAPRQREPLAHEGDPAHPSMDVLAGWFAQWHETRHRDASERVLLTAIESEASSAELTHLLFSGFHDRVYADTGHVFDLANKAVELVGVVGGDGKKLLPMTLPRAVASRGAEESSHWHHPHELIEPLREAESEIEELMRQGEAKQWSDDGSLQDVLLGDDAIYILDVLKAALAGGAPPTELSKRIAYAAAMRLARFAKSNEVGDWFNPQHTFNYANAVHQALQRSASPGVARGLFHGAMAVYQDRFLNVPPAALPGERHALDDLPDDSETLLDQLLEVLDQRSEIDTVGRIVARYLRLGHAPEALFDTLVFATVREDLDFHTLQVLEAGIQQFTEWSANGADGADSARAEHIMVGVARQLAAFCPTPRAGHQTATIARRLLLGEKVYEDD